MNKIALGVFAVAALLVASYFTVLVSAALYLSKGAFLAVLLAGGILALALLELIELWAAKYFGD